MALTALSLTDPKYAWVVRPVEVEEVCVGVWVRGGGGGGLMGGQTSGGGGGMCRCVGEREGGGGGTHGWSDQWRWRRYV